MRSDADSRAAHPEELPKTEDPQKQQATKEQHVKDLQKTKNNYAILAAATIMIFAMFFCMIPADKPF